MLSSRTVGTLSSHCKHPVTSVSDERKQNNIKSLILKLSFHLFDFKCLLVLSNVVHIENCPEFLKIFLFCKNSEIFHKNQNV